MKALVLGFILAAGAARGADSVHFVGFAGDKPTPAVTPVTFGNRTQLIDIEVDGAAGATGSLSADLYEVAGQLALPLVKKIELKKGVTLAEGAPLRVSLRFPDVRRRTELLVVFALVPSIPAQEPLMLGKVRFEIFPESTIKDLAGILRHKDEASRVEIFGPGRKLRQFLTSLHVTYKEGGDGVPDNFEPGRLYLGELTDAAQFQEIQDRAPGARILVFAPDESLPSGVYFDRTGSCVLGHVTAPLLDNIADDPRSQLELTKMLALLSSSSPTPSCP